MKSLISRFIKFIGKINWENKNTIPESDLSEIKDLLKSDYYIILTRRKNHLSTYLISLAHLLIRFRLGHYGHVLMNLENEVNADDDFRLIEALGTGVQYSTFSNVFNVHSVALLRPKNMEIEKWTSVLDAARSQLGKSYDTLFDLKSDTAVSCVEMIRSALLADPDYYRNFSNFERMVTSSINLTPQMFYECEDFEVVYEIRT